MYSQKPNVYCINRTGSVRKPYAQVLLNLLFPLILAFTTVKVASSQNLAAYSDYRDHFFIFDHGKSIRAEDLKVQSFKIGGECVLYINNRGNLKLYYKGRITQLEIGGVVDYYATDHLAAYQVFEKLKVIQGGKVTTLSTRCPKPMYSVQDSLIVFYDKNYESLRVFYDGSVTDIESGLVGTPFSYISSGDNIVAYISSQTNDFKVYYNGENTTLLKNIEGLSFKAGKDVVAFINPLDKTFNVFYKGNIIKLEDFPPSSYKVGDGFVAYVSNEGEFNVFYRGKKQVASSFAPDTYITTDNLMLFTESDYTKVFYLGKVYDLEGYVPRMYKLDWNTVVYLDNTNRVWVFSKGEKSYLTNDLINSFEVYRDLILLNVKVDRNIIYYDGKFYNGLSY